MKRLLIESHVPYVPSEISHLFNVSVLPPEEITPEAVKNFDAMIIRTRTRCNTDLLEGSPVEFIATATIGTDHIDLPYCRNRNIEVASAPGCNAPAVAQYVFASLLAVGQQLKGRTIGVVGVGHVGSIVVDWAKQLGMNVLECDPPRRDELIAKGLPADRFVDLDCIAAEADIVTFHVPSTTDGPYPTFHLADERFFNALHPGATIINAARGPIVDTVALIRALDTRQVDTAIIDTWENEPNISGELLSRAAIATPHIAGYSEYGKIRATTAAINALCRHFQVDYTYSPNIPAGASESVSEASIAASYNPRLDTATLRSNPAQFESLRNNYHLRPETP